MDYILLEFWNSCDLAGIFYQKGFKQRLFIDSDMVRPKYDVKEEGYDDGDGNFIKTLVREQKVFKIDWIVYEYMLDVIYTIPLHSDVMLYLKNGESERIQDIVIEHEFITAGVAKVIMTFRTRYVIKTNCCNNIETLACVVKNKPDILGRINYALLPSYTLTHNARYIIYNGSGSLYTNNGIYQYIAGKGVLGKVDTAVTGDVVYATGSSSNWYFDGVNWQTYPYLTSLTSPLATKLLIKGWSVPYTWVKVYYKKSTDPAYTLYPTIYTVEQLKNGITLPSLTSGLTYNVKIYSYNHNCIYGMSNILTRLVT